MQDFSEIVVDKDLNDLVVAEKVLLELKEKSCIDWDIYKELRGKRNHVIYRKSNYYVKNDHLICSGILDDYSCMLPFNCSSTYEMFAYTHFKGNVYIDFENVKDAACMFSGCFFDSGLTIRLRFDEDTDVTSMFSRCVFGDGCKIEIECDNVTIFNEMFERCIFRENCTLRMSNVAAINMKYMFYEADIANGFKLEGNFHVYKDIWNVFNYCALPGGRTSLTFKTDEDVVMYLSSHISE